MNCVPRDSGSRFGLSTMPCAVQPTPPVELYMTMRPSFSAAGEVDGGPSLSDHATYTLPSAAAIAGYVFVRKVALLCEVLSSNGTIEGVTSSPFENVCPPS